MPFVPKRPSRIPLIKTIVWSADESKYQLQASRTLANRYITADDNQLRSVWLVVCLFFLNLGDAHPYDTRFSRTSWRCMGER